MKGQKNENTAVFMLNEGFEITYTDKTTGEFFPAAKSGEHCYRALWNRNEPCEDCPVTEDAGDLSGAYYKGEYTISYKPMTCADGSRTYMVSACKNTLCGSDEDRLDSLTGLYRPEGFKNAAAQLLENDERDFFIAYIDIEHFKLYNDWYGYEAGDALLVSLAKLVKEKAAAEYGVACHFGSDDFVLLLPDINDNAQRLINDVKKWTDEAELEINFTPVIGLYRITDRTVSIDLMCDFASLAMNNCKGDYTTPYKWYEQDMRRKLEEEQELFAEAKKALERREFKVYFQPKCNMADGKIVGNEALVRWPHPEKGMISPGKFIPVLEKNGFIYRLDLYVWEEVCRYQRRLLDKGITPLPVSVNVSRVDIYKENVPEMFNALIERYRLPPELIELEITESAYMSDYRQLEGVVKDLRQRGFTVLMDDFGSGYSSLNVLKDIEVDIIKIDMKFLEMSEETRQKGGSILESIIRMAKWLGYRVIAEGTETDEQVDGLLKMGCQYGQGYHFYRPMPYEDYEKLIEDESLIDRGGIKPVLLEEVGLTELFHNDVMTESMLSNIMGGVALYTLENGELYLLRANKQYYDITGRKHRYGSESHDKISDFVVEQDWEIFNAALVKAEKSGNEGAICTIRIKRETDGEIMWGHCRLFFLRESKGVGFFYAAITDATAEKQSEQELRDSQQQLSAALGALNSDGTLENLRDQNRIAAINVFAELTPGGMCGCYCEEGLPFYYANDGMVKLAGYDSYEDMLAGTVGKVAATIYEDDLDRVMRAISDFCEGEEYEVKYRLVCKDGSLKWVTDAGRFICAEDGRHAIVSAIYDINDVVKAEQMAYNAAKELRRSNSELSILVNNLPVGYYKISYCENPKICYASSKFLELVECTSEELHEKYDDRFINLVHPDDRAMLEESFLGGDMPAVQYRIVTKSGIKVVYGSANLVREDDGKSYAYCLMQDVTESVNLRRQRRVVLANCPGDIFKATKDRMEFFSYNRGEAMGYTQEEYMHVVKHKTSGSITYDGDKPIVRRAFAEAYANRTDISVVYRSVRKDGGLSWTRMSAKCEIENGEPVFYGILQDVDELMMAQNSVKSILDCISGDIARIYVSENDFKVDILDGSLGVCLGYGDEGGCVKAMRELGAGFYHPDDLPAIAQLCAYHIKEHGPIDAKVRCVRADGGYSLVRCRAIYSHTDGNGLAVYDGPLILASECNS